MKKRPEDHERVVSLICRRNCEGHVLVFNSSEEDQKLLEKAKELKWVDEGGYLTALGKRVVSFVES